MVQKQYKLSYLPIFYDDLLDAVNYIMLKLKNEQAEEELINLTEMAIKERLGSPESFEKFQSERIQKKWNIFCNRFGNDFYKNI